MADFKIDDLGKPLYEWSQVITINELLVAYKDVRDHHNSLPWWQFIRAYNDRVALFVLYELIAFLSKGKKGKENV